MKKDRFENRLLEAEIKRLERYANSIIGTKQRELNQTEYDEQNMFKKEMNKNKSIKKTLKQYAFLRKTIKEIEEANDLNFVTQENKCPEEYYFDVKYNWVSKDKTKHKREIKQLERIKRKLEKWTAKNNRQKAMTIIEELEIKANLKNE